MPSKSLQPARSPSSRCPPSPSLGSAKNQPVYSPEWLPLSCVLVRLIFPVSYRTCQTLTTLGVRITGSFEAFNAPSNMFFLGGGQQESHWEGLRLLGEWVGRRVLRLESAKDGKAWGKELVMEVARRNAEMVAGWQVCCWRFFTGCVRMRH